MMPDAKITVSSVGDVSFAGGFVNRRGLITTWMEDDIRAFLKADIIAANLESLFLPEGETRPRGLCLAEPAEAVGALKNKGFNFVSLANNHILDYKREIGMLETMRVLNDTGIKYSGAGMSVIEASKPALFEICGVKVAVFSRLHDYSFTNVRPITAGRNSPGVALLDRTELVRDIRILRESGGCDIVILCIHWGMQNLHYHSSVVHGLGRDLLLNGVDLILGSHAHVLQGLARFGNKYCFFGQGNFYFFPFPLRGQPGGVLYGPEALRHRISAVSKFELNAGKWSYRMVPVIQGSDEIVRIIKGRKARRLVSMASSHWNRDDVFLYGLFWRIETIKKHFSKFFNKGLKYCSAETLKWYLNPVNWAEIAADVIKPRSLG